MRCAHRANHEDQSIFCLAGECLYARSHLLEIGTKAQVGGHARRCRLRDDLHRSHRTTTAARAGWSGRASSIRMSPKHVEQDRKAERHNGRMRTRQRASFTRTALAGGVRCRDWMSRRGVLDGHTAEVRCPVSYESGAAGLRPVQPANVDCESCLNDAGAPGRPRLRAPMRAASSDKQSTLQRVYRWGKRRNRISRAW